MRLRLLGPLDLVVDHRSLDIGGPRQRVVLAMLALNANRVTPVEQLIDAVWDASPPPTVRSQIQICISALRKVFKDAGLAWSIKTRSPGYLLDIATHELDSEEFTRLVAVARAHSDAGRATEAAATLHSALALWRGPALAGIQSELVQRDAARLEDSRLAATMERVRLDLALGRHDEISGELAALVAEHPLRERFYEFLMLALYRSGRQAEALEVCRRARTTLVEELGIEPGQELQSLETAILHRDPTLDLQPTSAELSAFDEEHLVVEQQVVPRQLPASIADFTGRETHIAEIKRILSEEPGPEAAPYAVRIVCISGKGGVGKSSLAIRVAHELGSAFPDGHLFADLQAPNGEDRTSTLLARFLRALGVNGPAIPDDLEERAEMYRSRLASKRLLVVLDDVSSEEQIQLLLPGGPSCAVIATSRVRLSGLSGARLIDIEVFDVEHALHMLAKIIGESRVQAEPAAAVELVDLCGALPLALRIAGARLVSRPHWPISGLVKRLRNEARRLDELSHRGLELRSNIGLIYRGLHPRAKLLFRLFVLVEAPDFPPWAAAALLDTDPFDAEEVLESLVDAQMLDTVEYPGERPRYRFHDLLRVYARERLLEKETPVQRNDALARVLGTWLALAKQAHGKEHGGDYTILHGNALLVRPETVGADPVDNPMQWWESERRSLVAAIRQAGSAGLDDLCWDLAFTLVTLFEVKGYFDDWRETTQLALELTERAGNRTGHAAMLYSLGTLHLAQKRLDEAEQYLAAALEMFSEDGNVHGCALVLRNSAIVDRYHGRFRDMLTKYEKALDMMRTVGDLVGEAHVLQSLASYRVDEGDIDLARAHLDRALALCQQVNYIRGEAQVVNRFAELYLDTDQIELARQALHRVLLIVRNIGDKTGEAHALYGLGIVRHREGRLDNAQTTLMHACSLAKLVGERMIEGKALHTLGEIELARGNDSAGAAHLAEAQRLFDDLGAALWQAKTLILLSEVHTGDGDLAMASHEVELAVQLLSEMDSVEATRLLAQLETTRSALLTNDRVGC